MRVFDRLDQGELKSSSGRPFLISRRWGPTSCGSSGVIKPAGGAGPRTQSAPSGQIRGTTTVAARVRPPAASVRCGQWGAWRRPGGQVGPTRGGGQQESVAQDGGR